MNNYKLYLVASILLIFYMLMPQNGKCQNKVSAAKKPVAVFTWEDGICTNQGQYDPHKYTANQLQNTLDIWVNGSIALSTDATVFSAGQISKLSVDALTKEYNSKKHYFDTLQIINTSFWNKMKQLRIQELEEEYEIKKITIQAYSDVSVLKSNRFSELCPPDIFQALTCGEDKVLLSFWKTFVEKQCAINGNPQECMNRFYYNNLNSPDKIMEAKAYLITFGWWNSVNERLMNLRESNTGTLMGQMVMEYDELFIHIKKECDEP